MLTIQFLCYVLRYLCELCGILEIEKNMKMKGALSLIYKLSLILSLKFT
jgi:hypothetical protein